MPTRMTTLPRSKGPAWAGVLTDEAVGGAFVGAREINRGRGLARLGDPEGAGPGPAATAVVPTCEAAGQAPPAALRLRAERDARRAWRAARAAA